MKTMHRTSAHHSGRSASRACRARNRERFAALAVNSRRGAIFPRTPGVRRFTLHARTPWGYGLPLTPHCLGKQACKANCHVYNRVTIVTIFLLVTVPSAEADSQDEDNKKGVPHTFQGYWFPPFRLRKKKLGSKGICDTIEDADESIASSSKISKQQQKRWKTPNHGEQEQTVKTG